MSSAKRAAEASFGVLPDLPNFKGSLHELPPRRNKRVAPRRVFGRGEAVGD